MSDLRQRYAQQPSSETPEEDDVTDSSLSESDDNEDEDDDEDDGDRDGEAIQNRIAEEDGDGRFISPLDILRVLFALTLFVGAFSYFITSESFLLGYKPWFTNVPAVLSYFVRLFAYLLYNIRLVC